MYASLSNAKRLLQRMVCISMRIYMSHYRGSHKVLETSELLDASGKSIRPSIHPTSLIFLLW